MLSSLPVWIIVLLAILFGYLVLPRIVAYTGMKAG